MRRYSSAPLCSWKGCPCPPSVLVCVRVLIQRARTDPHSAIVYQVQGTPNAAVKPANAATAPRQRRRTSIGRHTTAWTASTATTTAVSRLRKAKGSRNGF